MKPSICSLSLVGLLLAAGFAAFARQEAEPRRPDADGDDRPAAAVHPRPIYVRWTFPDEAVIRSILPPGTRVAKDQLVCECGGDEGLRNELAFQPVVIEGAKKYFETAKSMLELAEFGLKAYLEVLHPRELMDAEIKITGARLELEAARERLVKAEAAGGAEARLGRFKVDLAELELEKAETELEALKKFGFDKNRLALEADIERARAEMLDRSSAVSEAKHHADKLRRAIDGLKVYAPAAGVLEYRERRIGPDAVVRRGTLLFVIHPDEPAEPVASNPTNNRAHLDLDVVSFLRDELGTHRIVEEPLTDEEVEALAADATDRLGRTVTPSAVRIVIGYSKLREEWRKKRLGSPDAPEADRGDGPPDEGSGCGSASPATVGDGPPPPAAKRSSFVTADLSPIDDTGGGVPVVRGSPQSSPRGRPAVAVASPDSPMPCSGPTPVWLGRSPRCARISQRAAPGRRGLRPSHTASGGAGRCRRDRGPWTTSGPLRRRLRTATERTQIKRAPSRGTGVHDRIYVDRPSADRAHRLDSCPCRTGARQRARQNPPARMAVTGRPVRMARGRWDVDVAIPGHGPWLHHGASRRGPHRSEPNDGGRRCGQIPYRSGLTTNDVRRTEAHRADPGPPPTGLGDLPRSNRPRRAVRHDRSAGGPRRSEANRSGRRGEKRDSQYRVTSNGRRRTETHRTAPGPRPGRSPRRSAGARKRRSPRQRPRRGGRCRGDRWETVCRRDGRLSPRAAGRSG